MSRGGYRVWGLSGSVLVGGWESGTEGLGVKGKGGLGVRDKQGKGGLGVRDKQGKGGLGVRDEQGKGGLGVRDKQGKGGLGVRDWGSLSDLHAPQVHFIWRCQVWVRHACLPRGPRPVPRTVHRAAHPPAAAAGARGHRGGGGGCQGRRREHHRRHWRRRVHEPHAAQGGGPGLTCGTQALAAGQPASGGSGQGVTASRPRLMGAWEGAGWRGGGGRGRCFKFEAGRGALCKGSVGVDGLLFLLLLGVEEGGGGEGRTGGNGLVNLANCGSCFTPLPQYLLILPS